jgi:D-alanyl-lipoteichoic acid acyltransferase DltB (MBOAT superfamily)
VQLNSAVYLLAFLPLVALFVSSSKSHERKIWVLLAASSAFYLSNGAAQAWALAISLLANKLVAVRVGDRELASSARVRWLWVGLAFNVLLLAAFKYTPIRLPPTFGGWPLGLSFFTLTQIMYLVDCYEGLQAPLRFRDHVAFVSFFPNITAGPLLRSRLFLRELPALGSGALRAEGLLLVSVGVAKKIILGDSFARIANAGYATPDGLSIASAWLISLAGTFEFYFDFSGYSDIALGSAMILGMRLVRNFDAPFRSQTISEFWRRWHISLSDFITTYLFTPVVRRLGKVTLRTSAVATIFAMTIAGVWHGANVNYILFGLAHGCALAAYQFWKRRKTPLPDLAGLLLTFLFVHGTFVLVKAPDVSKAAAVLATLVGALDSSSFDLFSLMPIGDWRFFGLPAAIGAIIAFVGPTSDSFSRECKPTAKVLVAMLLMWVAAYIYGTAGSATDFRYRQF